MDHNKQTRLMHFTDKELQILGIEVTPLKDNQAARLRQIALAKVAMYTQELIHIYQGSEFDSSLQQMDPSELRDLSESASILALELATVDDLVSAMHSANVR